MCKTAEIKFCWNTVCACQKAVIYNWNVLWRENYKKKMKFNGSIKSQREYPDSHAYISVNICGNKAQIHAIVPPMNVILPSKKMLLVTVGKPERLNAQLLLLNLFPLQSAFRCSRLQIVGASPSSTPHRRQPCQHKDTDAMYVSAASVHPPHVCERRWNIRRTFERLLSASARCDTPVAKRAFGTQRALSNFISVLNNINVPSQFTYKMNVLHLDLWQGCVSVNRHMFSLSVKKLGLVLPPACHTAEVTGIVPHSSMHRRLNKYQFQAWHLANVCMVGYICIVYRSGLKAPRVVCQSTTETPQTQT